MLSHASMTPVLAVVALNFSLKAANRRATA